MQGYIPDIQDAQESKVSESKYCPNCLSTKIAISDHARSCSNCGLVLNEIHVDSGWEANGYSGIVNKLIPQLSTKTYICGNGKIKMLNFWQNTPYLESSLLRERSNLRNILGRHLAKDLVEQLTDKTMLNFRKLKELRVITRDKIKMAVIAKCFQKVCQDQYVFYTNTDLKRIFDLSDHALSTGNNKLNRYTKKYPELRGTFSTNPATIQDLIQRLPRLFPELTRIDIVRKYANRITNLPVALVNSANSILAGILQNCIQIHGIGLTRAIVIERLQISESTMNKYQIIMSPFVYRLD